MKMSRRSWLAGFGALAAGTTWLPRAAATPTPAKSAVVSIFFEGGFNAIFSSADAFLSKNAFGVTSSNVRDLGNGLVVDASTMGALGDWATTHMASIGNRHGTTDHLTAVRRNFHDDGRTFAVELAAAIGGDASFKAVALGGQPTSGPSSTRDGVSLQLMRSMEDVARALGVGVADPARPERATAGAAIAHARAMSEPMLKANPRSLRTARDGYDTAVAALSKPPLAVDVAGIAQAYGVGSAGKLESIPAKLAAAELMLRSGTNVITISDLAWDTHGDPRGATARRRMSSDVVPGLKTFLARLRSDATLAAMNVSILLHGDFARSLPSSDHAPGLSALVIGPNVKVGTTGRVSANVTLPAGTGASREMWSYLAAISKVAQNPFGANPHALVR